MDKPGVFGEILEHGQSLADKTGKAVKKQIATTVKSAASQVAGGGNQTDQPGQNQTQTPTVDENFVKDLYGIKDKTSSTSTKPQGKATGQSQTAVTDEQSLQNPKKIEEQQKLAKLRQELHQTTYYEPLVHPKKEKQEERPAEKVEQEKEMEKLEEHEKEKKKPQPLAVQKNQQRVEKHPGVSG